jgi:tetratricopeptide (TPR) repeat protein
MSVTPDASPPTVEPWEVLDLLTSLVQKSLAVYEEDEHGHGRYRLLETVRQYARDRLLEAEDTVDVRDQHRDWFLALAEEEHDRAEKERNGLERLQGERDNLHAALGWVLERGEVELGFRFAEALTWFWYEYGLAEGREYLARLLALLRAPSQLDARGRTLDSAATLAQQQGDHGAAEAFYQESLAISQELGQRQRVGSCRFHLGWVAHAQGDFERARAQFEQGLAIAQELGDQQLAAWSVNAQGRMAWLMGDLGHASALYQKSLTVFRAMGMKDGIAHALVNLANTSNAQGDQRTARALLEEALVVSREVEGRIYRSNHCMNQGHALLSLGDYAAARSRFEEGLALRRAAEKPGYVAWALVEVGHAAWLQGEPVVTRSHAVEALRLLQKPESEFEKTGILAAVESLAVAALAWREGERAARLMGAAEALRQALRLPAPSHWRRPRERIEEAVRAAALEQELAVAWAEGRAMSLDQAIEYALEAGPALPNGQEHQGAMRNA